MHMAQCTDGSDLTGNAKEGLVAGDRNTHGYTLAELMVVLAIIGIVVTIAIASYTLAISRAQAATCAASRRSMTRAVEVYLAETGHYPTDVNDLHEIVANWSSASKCPSGPPLFYDSSTHSVVCPVHGT